MAKSTLGADPPRFLTSVDCRILQYRYNAIKLGALLRSLRRLIKETELPASADISVHLNDKTDCGSPCTSSDSSATVFSDPSSVSNELTTISGTPSDSNQPSSNPDISTCAPTSAKDSEFASEAPSLELNATPPAKVPLSLFSLPLVQYVVLLASPVFAINHSAFQKRLELLAQFKLFRIMPIQISPSPTHIPYEQPDIEPNALHDLPLLSIALKCLKALSSLAELAVKGYAKKLVQAKDEREASFGPAPDGYYNDIDQIALEIFDCDDDLDLTLAQTVLPVQINATHEDYAASTLIDMDIKMLFVLSQSMQRTLGRLSSRVKSLRAMDDSQAVGCYGLHQAFLLILRLNELGAIFRHFGRNAYFANSQHLHYQKFLSMNKNPSYFKQVVLRGLENMVVGPKGNGALVANLTRLIRHGSRHEVDSKNVVEFTKFVGQSIEHLGVSNTKVGEFTLGWLLTEIRYRKEMNLPISTLQVIHEKFGFIVDPIVNGSATTTAPEKSVPTGPSALSGALRLARSKDAASTNSIKTPMGSTHNIKGMTTKKPIPDLNGSLENSMPLMTPQSAQQSDIASDSSSISSLNSILSTASSQRTLVATFQTQHRLYKSNSEDHLPAATKTRDSSVGINRSRSNSQPIRGSECMATRAAAGSFRAAGASFRAPEPRSLPISSKRSSKIYASPSPDAGSQGKSLHSVQEGEEQLPRLKPLTAQQKFNQRIRQAAKSGSLMTQPMNSQTAYVFDPSYPDYRQGSVYKTKPEAPVTIEQPAKPESSDPPSKPDNAPSPGPVRVVSVRDTITRRNTRKNSVSAPAPPVLEMTAADDNGPIFVKKVRFTGIPPYNEAEEVSANFANKILKGFPAYTPSTSQFKRKDRLLRKEESLEFRHQLHDPQNETSTAPSFSEQVSAQLAELSVQSPPPRKALSRLRKLL